jgi:hypothetical protein
MGFPPGFESFLIGQVGGKMDLEHAERNCVGKQTPKKGLFFHSIAGFMIVFEAVEEEKGDRRIRRSGRTGGFDTYTCSERTRGLFAIYKFFCGDG